jgi:hypothetical protein
VSYRVSGKHRTVWKNLPDASPRLWPPLIAITTTVRTSTAKVLNPVGVDFKPAVARGMGLRKYQNAWIYISFSWVRR